MTGQRARARGPRRRLRAAGLAVLAGLLVPAVASAHPLGNFTINHFAGLHLAQTGITVDVVIDRAEIPTFQERQRIDTDGDGTVSPAEIEAERAVACDTLAGSLSLAIAGLPRPLAAVAAGLTFPAGAGGLDTMRLVCEYVVAGPIAPGALIEFRDDAFQERIGWREIVAVDASGPVGGLASRLTAYPADLLTQPPTTRSFSIVAPGAMPQSSDWIAPDAQALAGRLLPGSAGAGSGADLVTGTGATVSSQALGMVPGGVGGDLSSLVGTADLTPLAVIVSLLIAVGLGAAHAVSPGHGKTIMAAYLVGRGGTTRHAVGLGLTVAVSHTLGVLALAAITLLAADILPPERLYPILQVASGSLVVAIGGSLLATRLRLWLRSRARQQAHQPETAQPHPHGKADVVFYPDGTHSHGGGRPHRHLPDAASGLSRRALFGLGLSGGLVPSASALILLLGSIAIGRVAYGLVLVAAFGVGMALVLGGVGFLVVRASALLERIPSTARVARASGALQAVTAVLVVALGVALTGQALHQVL